jgi:predicted O-methyltransferase YrrM
MASRRCARKINSQILAILTARSTLSRSEKWVSICKGFPHVFRMDDDWNLAMPAALETIRRETSAAGFNMASDDLTGALLRTLAASKPGGKLLELGTGTGAGTAWLLAGMDEKSHLDTVDNDACVVTIAERALGNDPRVRFHVADGATFLAQLQGRTFDVVFADTWPGKFDHLNEALALVAPGGLYIIDDLLPQPNWPEGHAAKIPPLLRSLSERRDLLITRMTWSTGIVIAARTG